MTELQSMSEFDADAYRYRIDTVTERIALHQRRFSNEGVRRHLMEGLGRRLDMLKHCLFVYKRLPASGGRSLPDHAIIELNSTINSTYLNFTGALDNAAWAMAYELGLKHPLSENDPKHRKFITLFGDIFLGSVGEQEPNIALELEQFKKWGKELKQYRDPAAHRIPMYVPPGAILQADAAALREREAAALRIAKETGDMDALYSAVNAYKTLGRFLPQLIISEQNGYSEKPLLPLLSRDYGQFLNAISIVVNYCSPVDLTRVSD